MKIGYLLDTHAGDYDRPRPTRDEVSAFIDQMHAEIDLCEKYGFDSIQVPERHGRSECYFPNPLTLLAALAERTKKTRLGTYICIPPLHNPMELAEQFALIDQLSRGRLIMGVASGYHPGYSQFFGVPHEKRGAMFEEGFDVILQAWKGEKFTHEGKYYQFRDVMLSPTPYQTPRPEIWVGGMFPKTIARAGKMGDAWCSDPFPLDKQRWFEQVKLYRDSAKEHGNRSQVVLMRDAWCAMSPEEEDLFLRVTIEEWLFYFRYGILDASSRFQEGIGLHARAGAQAFHYWQAGRVCSGDRDIREGVRRRLPCAALPIAKRSGSQIGAEVAGIVWQGSYAQVSDCSVEREEELCRSYR